MDAKIVDIDELIPDPDNLRQHSAENIAAIEASLERVGPARSLVIDQGGVVRAGNGTLEAAKRRGIRKVKIVDTDGSSLVAVRVRGLTEEQLRFLSIADNRAAELATWDAAAIRNLDAQGVDLKEWWGASELTALLSQAPPAPLEEQAAAAADDLEYKREKFKPVPSFYLGKQRLRVLPEEADVVDDALHAFADDLGALAAAICCT